MTPAGRAGRIGSTLYRQAGQGITIITIMTTLTLTMVEVTRTMFRQPVDIGAAGIIYGTQLFFTKEGLMQ